jgi:twitching motility protein PilT
MIRARQTHQLRSTISVSAKDGMQTLDQSLKALIDDGKITKETALPWVVEKNIF